LATNWFDTIAQLEVIGSFAVLHFNNPGWVFPLIADEHFKLSGKNIGHPLISQQYRVNNDFAVNGTAKS
jgi:DNA mismatch repair ATPase MutS